jgi:hypothetical protein
MESSQRSVTGKMDEEPFLQIVLGESIKE